MGTSRQWPVLQEMDADGDYPEVVWDYADQVGAGQVPEGYREGLGLLVSAALAPMARESRRAAARPGRAAAPPPRR